MKKLLTIFIVLIFLSNNSSYSKNTYNKPIEQTYKTEKTKKHTFQYRKNNNLMFNDSKNKTSKKNNAKFNNSTKESEQKLNNKLSTKNAEDKLKILNTLLEKQPENQEYLKAIINIYIKKKEYENALKYLKKINNLDENDYINLFECYYQLAKYNEATYILDNLPQNIPISEELLNLKIKLELKKQEYSKAIESYQKLIENYPNPEYKLRLADLLISEEKYSQAEDIIRQEYESGNNSKKITEKYLQILYNQDKLEEGLDIAKKNNLLNSRWGMIIQADLSIESKDYTLARTIYEHLIVKSSYDKFAQMGLSNSYISTGSDIKSIKDLKKCPACSTTKYLTAKAYYNLEMYEEAFNILKDLPQTKDILTLENKIKRNRSYSSSYGYELYTQKLQEEYKLDANKIAFSNSCYQKNMQIYLDYIMYIYKSGKYPGQSYEPINNFTNEIRLGTQGRLNEHWAIKGDIGVKIFQDYGAMIITDDWIKYFYNDRINFKLGFQRNNVEQSYLSAVGIKTSDNIFVGQVADNNVYIDTTIRLPKQSYLFTKSGFGIMTGQNLPNNIYWEGMAGFGKLLRYNLEKPYLQKISIDLVSYNSGYQKNLIDIYDSKKYLYGGYFSPTWYTSNTTNINISGRFKQTKLTYGLGGYAGWQYSYQPYKSIFIWGTTFYLNYRINDYVDLNTQYRYYNYADVQRNQFIFNIIIRGFKHYKKN